MRNDPEGRRLKQQLPYPYNQDLSKVLRGLKRRALKFRARLANDPATAAYLCAAVRLIRATWVQARTAYRPMQETRIPSPVLC